jgi:hypothetical protein
MSAILEVAGSLIAGHGNRISQCGEGMTLKQIFLVSLVAIGGALSFAAPSFAAENSVQTPPNRGMADLETLRRIYPPGYADATIRAIEDGQVPGDLSIPEYSRLHCGEIGVMVFNPCLVSYPGEYGVEYVVITQGENRRIGNRQDAVSFYRAQVASTVMNFESEVSAINTFVDTLCDHVSAGGNIREVLPPRDQWPRIDHPIAPPNHAARRQFSDLFSSEKCEDCVGLIAVNMAIQLPPTCATLSKQPKPKVTYFVVDRQTSRGHGALETGLEAWGTRISEK